MTDEHIVTAGSLTALLQSVRMEIDDDDEDIVEVSIELTNESAIPVGGLGQQFRQVRVRLSSQ